MNMIDIKAISKKNVRFRTPHVMKPDTYTSKIVKILPETVVVQPLLNKQEKEFDKGILSWIAL